MTTLGRRPFLFTVSGIDHYPVISNVASPGFFRECLKYKPLDSDIFVASYPKSGTTWVQMMVWLLKNNLESPTFEEEIIEDNFLELYLGKKGAENLKLPRQIKTHLPFDLVPYNKNTKYVYTCRNPFDVCVSFYKHTCHYVQDYEYDGTFDEYFELFIRGQVDSGDYFHHVMSWYAHKDDPNMLWLIYEEMKADPRTAMVKVGEFLGGSYADMVHDEETLDKLIVKSSFDAMKRLKTRNTTEVKENTSFFRKGAVGDHRSHFSEAQRERLREKYECCLKGSSLYNVFEAYT
ncbi:Uncharacterised protein g5785 [Pycnogonum litorale]